MNFFLSSIKSLSLFGVSFSQKQHVTFVLKSNSFKFFSRENDRQKRSSDLRKKNTMREEEDEERNGALDPLLLREEDEDKDDRGEEEEEEEKGEIDDCEA